MAQKVNTTNNNGNENKELDWSSVYAVNKAYARQAQEAQEIVDIDFEEAYDDWKYRLADGLYEFFSTAGIAVLWFVIVVGAFHWFIYGM